MNTNWKKENREAKPRPTRTLNQMVKRVAVPAFVVAVTALAAFLASQVGEENADYNPKDIEPVLDYEYEDGKSASG